MNPGIQACDGSHRGSCCQQQVCHVLVHIQHCNSPPILHMDHSVLACSHQIKGTNACVAQPIDMLANLTRCRDELPADESDTLGSKWWQVWDETPIESKKRKSEVQDCPVKVSMELTVRHACLSFVWPAFSQAIVECRSSFFRNAETSALR